MGSDYWEGSFRDSPGSDPGGQPAVGVGVNCLIRRAIIDKNARVGDGSRLVNESGLDSFDGDGYFIRDGIIVIPKNGVVRPGTVI